MMILPLQTDSIGERGFLIKNVRFKGGNKLHKIKGFFLDIFLEMISVTIENIRSCELVGIRSLLKIENSTFYLEYPCKLDGGQTSFFLLEKSELILKEILITGNSEEKIEEISTNVFCFCIIESKITIFRILMQKIFLDNVLS